MPADHNIGKILNKRYQIQLTYSDFDDCYIAQDLNSLDEQTVYIRVFRHAKQPDLFHIFMNRANKLTQLSHPSIIPLIDYGFDASKNLFYLIYPIIHGAVLEAQVESLEIEVGLQILVDICDAIAYLHSQGISHGSLTPKSILLGIHGELPPRLTEIGFEWLLNIFAETKLGRADLEQRDLDQLGHVAGQIVCQKLLIDTDELITALTAKPASLYTFFCRMYHADGYAPYKAVSEIRRELAQSLLDLHSQSLYYLQLTTTVARNLFDTAFIPQPEIYLARNLLNHELTSGRIVGRAVQDKDENTITYLISTPRFTLVCREDWNGSQTHLVVINIRFPSPTTLLYEQEQGFEITDSLKVETSTTTPANANVAPLTEKLHAHKLETDAARRSALEEKNGIEIWRKALDLQRTILNSFDLRYSRWEYTDDDAAIWIQIEEDFDLLNLSGDERLCMSLADNPRKQTAVGFFEEIDGRQIKLGLARNVDMSLIAEQGRLTIDNIQVESILRRQEEAFRRLRFSESANPDLLNLLVGKKSLLIETKVKVQFLDNLLDQSQKEAIQYALGSTNIFLLQGPPGTGKTRTIVELVRQILYDHPQTPRILIASQSNVAVNNALSALLMADPSLAGYVIRVGNEEKADALTDYMLDRQLLRWAEEVKARSQKYIEEKRDALKVDAQLVECLNIINESKRQQQEIAENRSLVDKLEIERQHIERNLKALTDLTTEIQKLRQEVLSISDLISPDDETLSQITEVFNTQYLDWGHEFLRKFDDVAQLSFQRIEILKELDTRKAWLENAEQQILAAGELVRETLREAYNVDLRDEVSQTNFLSEKLNIQEETALKFGRLKKIAEDWAQVAGKDVESFASPFLSRCKVVGATCIGIAARGDVSNLTFDWVIIDEAGRSTHPEIVVPMVRGRKTILVGDHRQLPPIVDQEIQQKLLVLRHSGE